MQDFVPVFFNSPGKWVCGLWFFIPVFIPPVNGYLYL